MNKNAKSEQEECVGGNRGGASHNSPNKPRLPDLFKGFII